MNLHHLAIFAAVADAGSVTAAGDRLHISQSALSRELRSFEERLGVTLFERRPRGMQLTPPGTLLLEYAERLFALQKEAEAAMREAAGARRGSLVLGASNTIGTYVLPRVLAVFGRDRPAVDISLFVGNTEQVCEGVADLRFTLGFIEGPLHVETLQAQSFRQDEILPVVAAEHRLARKRRVRLADLAAETLLLREPGSGTRELIDRLLANRGLSDPRVMEFGNTEALKQAAVAHGGVAWLPRISMPAELASGALVVLALKSLWISRPLSIVHRRASTLSPVATALIDRLSAPDALF